MQLYLFYFFGQFILILQAKIVLQIAYKSYRTSSKQPTQTEAFFTFIAQTLWDELHAMFYTLV